MELENVSDNGIRKSVAEAQGVCFHAVVAAFKLPDGTALIIGASDVETLLKLAPVELDMESVVKVCVFREEDTTLVHKAQDSVKHSAIRS